MVALYLLLGVVLLLLNGFFVLAEFAVVRVRPTRIEALLRDGRAGAAAVWGVQERLDEFLSVCQVGITLASIGLGFVGELGIARLVEPAVLSLGAGGAAATHALAAAIAFGLVSYLHILIGELIPKSLAIRGAERAALATAPLLRLFRIAFYAPLVLLNGSANGILTLLRVRRAPVEESHTEDEVRIILARSQERGMLSFRRLLLLENILDLAGTKVRDAMQPRTRVRVLRHGAPWEENRRTIVESRFSRYPLVDAATGATRGIVHVKDVLHAGGAPEDLAALARPPLLVEGDMSLERLLSEMQRRRAHLALVSGPAGDWGGLITLEDVIEEIIGPVDDEFVAAARATVLQTLAPERVTLGLRAGSRDESFLEVLRSAPPGQLPLSPERVAGLLSARERDMNTYLGAGVAVPHTRIEGLGGPLLFLARSEAGI
ncbi:MAG: CNNM domain-containing protein, partial [Planctomycetales bacterium]|nr:CNNM domain-containing protein [Planctomycetales bacterium]